LSDAKQMLGVAAPVRANHHGDAAGSFGRVYDLTKRLLPTPVLAAAPVAEDVMCRVLIECADRVDGIATSVELCEYLCQPSQTARVVTKRLIEEGVLCTVQIDGWGQALLYCDACAPRWGEASALLAPFDPLIWQRHRAERLHGFPYPIETFVRAGKRGHGYCVMPFLLGDRSVGRVDLEADRQSVRFPVRVVHFEPDACDALLSEPEAIR
jgi:uncharacterized protein